MDAKFADDTRNNDRRICTLEYIRLTSAKNDQPTSGDVCDNVQFSVPIRFRQFDISGK